MGAVRRREVWFRPSGSKLKKAEESLVQNSIKAAFVMMLYNLAEAIVVSTIHEIFQRVRDEGLGYDAVADQIRDFWIERRAIRIKNGGSEKHSELIREAISTALRKEGLQPFEREEIRRSYLGNVDARLIRELAEGFALPLTPRKSSRGGSYPALELPFERRIIFLKTLSKQSAANNPHYYLPALK